MTIMIILCFVRDKGGFMLFGCVIGQSVDEQGKTLEFLFQRKDKFLYCSRHVGADVLYRQVLGPNRLTMIDEQCFCLWIFLANPILSPNCNSQVKVRGKTNREQREGSHYHRLCVLRSQSFQTRTSARLAHVCCIHTPLADS